MWCEIIKQILADMRQPLQYVPWALVIVVLGLVVTIVLSEKKDGKKASVRFFRILFAIYILVVIQITFFSREPGSRNGCMNLDLFSTWGYSVVTHAFFIENILMTVPFGILAPLCFRSQSRGSAGCSEVVRRLPHFADCTAHHLLQTRRCFHQA